MSIFRRIRQSLPAIVILILFFCVGVKSSFAQAAQTVTVLPPTQELSANPGDTIQIKAKIRNSGNTDFNVKVTINDFLPKGDQGQVEIAPSSPYSIVKWTTLKENSFTLSSGEDQTAVATVTIPKNTAGGRYGSFVFSITPKAAEKGGSATVAQNVASLFLIRINGPVNEKLVINQITAPSSREFGPIPFQIDLANKGNVHVKAFGIVSIYDMFGRNVVNIPVKAVNVFPETNRTVLVSYDQKLLLGKYKATAFLYYGQKNELLTSTVEFTVFPVRIAVGIFVVLVLIVIFRKKLLKLFKFILGIK